MNVARGLAHDASLERTEGQVFEADGTTPVSAPLVDGTDFSVAFIGDPTCEFRINTLSTAAAIEPAISFISAMVLPMPSIASTAPPVSL